MRAWRVNSDFSRSLVELPERAPPPGGVSVRMQVAPVLFYLREVIEGRLGYSLPSAPFTPGTNGIGVVEAVGAGVYHLRPGQRVILDPHLAVDERTPEPAQILIGLTATRSSGFGGIAEVAAALQHDWPDGTLAERACMPASVLTPLPGSLDGEPAARLVGLSKLGGAVWRVPARWAAGWGNGAGERRVGVFRVRRGHPVGRVGCLARGGGRTRPGGPGAPESGSRSARGDRHSERRSLPRHRAACRCCERARRSCPGHCRPRQCGDGDFRVSACASPRRPVGDDGRRGRSA